jgi:hypothetical protein
MNLEIEEYLPHDWKEPSKKELGFDDPEFFDDVALYDDDGLQ